MLSIRNFIRRSLAKRGYTLTKPERGVPPSIETYLRSLSEHRQAALHVLCLENEPGIQSQILNVFPITQVAFVSLSSSASGTSCGLSRPPGCFIAVVNADSLPVHHWEEKVSWLISAQDILLCSRLGSFWSGRLDLARLSAKIQALGFSIVDVLDSPRLSPSQGPSELFVLACTRSPIQRHASLDSRYRILEAMTYLSAPIVRFENFEIVAGRGTEGFAGGILNPGGIVENGRLVLLARGERFSWSEQKQDEAKLLTSSQPVVMYRSLSDSTLQTNALPAHNPAGATGARTEDFRLFRFRDTIFSNHAVMTGPTVAPRAGQPVQLGKMTSRIGLSRLVTDPCRLEWIGYPDLGRPLAQVEKNWAMFAEGERLFLLYSLSPYLLFECRDWHSLRFEVIVETPLMLPIGGDGLSIRNSVNPVLYDSDHWLHIIHRVYPNKQYTYWAVLISRQTLRPVKVSARPLIHGGASFPASIIYACSVVAGPETITIAAGLDDAATGVATFPRARLEAEWMPLS